MTTIRLATNDDDISSCYAVMAQLRPHIPQGEFINRVRSQMEQGYYLAYVESKGVPVACAGYRYGNNLAWGRFLYVDDLITDETQRSKGYGKKLLDWLSELAKSNGCAQLHLDSGMQRKEAHRFYLREGMDKAGYHFAVSL